MKVVLPLVALLYVISPIDLVPDMLLGPGQLDDLTVIALVVVMLGKLAKWAPAAVVEEHLAGMRRRGRRPAADPAGDGAVDVPFRIVDDR